MQQLKGSVGAAGLNRREDVAAVQQLLLPSAFRRAR